MRKIHILIFEFIFISCNLSGQPKPCNRAVDSPSYSKSLIKEVCIPSGYEIVLLHTEFKDIDIDGDGLGDFIFEYAKPNSKELDTTYLCVYKRLDDSTHVFLKAFNNLYPVYLKSYDYPSKHTKAAKVFECYAEGYPLKDLTLENGTISLTIRIDAASGYFLKYTYIPKKKNWYLTTYQEWINQSNGGKRFKDYPIPGEGESIDEFSYQKYLCPEESFKK